MCWRVKTSNGSRDYLNSDDLSFLFWTPWIADHLVRAIEHSISNMADFVGNNTGSSESHAGSSSKASTKHAFERTQNDDKELPVAASSTLTGDAISCSSRGKNYAKNQRKKFNRKAASAGKILLSEVNASNSRSSLRFQIKLQNGFFTNARRMNYLAI